MARPVNDPSWATDANFVSGIDTGTPTRVNPGAGYKAQGFIAQEEPSAAVLNQALGVLGDWASYLKDTNWLNWTPVSLAEFGLTGVGATLLAGAVGGYGAVSNPRVNQIFVASTGTNKILSSYDGLVWTERYSSASFSVSAHTTYTHAFWSNTAQKFLIGGAGSAAGFEVLSSPDGITWTNRTLPSGNLVTCFAESASIIVACDGLAAFFHTSPDGITWTARANPATNPAMVAIAWSGSIFVATNTIGEKITSPDGITWTNRGDPNAVASAPGRGLIWNGSVFISSGGVGSGTRETSPDGVTWTLQAPTLDLDGLSANISEMVIDGSTIYGVGEARTHLYKSEDSGATWDVQRLQGGFGKGFFKAPGRLVCYGAINSLPGLLLGMRTNT